MKKLISNIAVITLAAFILQACCEEGDPWEKHRKDTIDLSQEETKKDSNEELTDATSE